MGKKIQGFAHLFGFGASASEETEDDKEKSKKAKSRKAEEDKKDPDAEGDDEDDDQNKDQDEKDKEGSAAEDDDEADAEDGDDNDGDDEDEDRDVKKGRRAERKRCARIFGSKHAANRVDLAASLALNSGMSSAEAIRILASTATSTPDASNRKRSLDDRMRALGNVTVGQDINNAPSGSASALANKMTSLYNQTVGKK